MEPKQETEMWGLFNFKTLKGVFYRKQDAHNEAAASIGGTWRQAKKYYQVRRVRVVLVGPEQGRR